jgi:hypothetical protein
MHVERRVHARSAPTRLVTVDHPLRTGLHRIGSFAASRTTFVEPRARLRGKSNQVGGGSRLTLQQVEPLSWSPAPGSVASRTTLVEPATGSAVVRTTLVEARARLRGKSNHVGGARDRIRGKSNHVGGSPRPDPRQVEPRWWSPRPAPRWFEPLWCRTRPAPRWFEPLWCRGAIGSDREPG